MRIYGRVVRRKDAIAGPSFLERAVIFAELISKEHGKAGGTSPDEIAFHVEVDTEDEETASTRAAELVERLLDSAQLPITARQWVAGPSTSPV